MSSNNAASWTAMVGADSPATLFEFQEGLAVRLIATARAAFKTCSPDDTLSSVVENNEDGFDYFPVVEVGKATPGRIVGLLHVFPFMGSAERSGLVRERMDPLSEDNLIGGDASILTFLRNADRHECRLIVTGPEIYGLVTISDLHRLPVRAALFTMVTHLEMTMADAIRREFPCGEGWLDRMSDSRRAKFNQEVAEARSHDSFVDDLLFTQFADKRDIIKNSKLFKWSKSSYVRDMKLIRSLRDNVSHANAYAYTRETATRTCETVKLIDRWIGQLSEFPAN